MKKSSDMVNIIYRRGLLQEGDVIEIHSEGCIGAGVSGKVGRENGARECPDGGTHNSTCYAFILEKGERSRVVRSYADVTREDLKTPLGQNILIIS